MPKPVTAKMGAHMQIFDDMLFQPQVRDNLNVIANHILLYEPRIGLAIY